MDNVYGCICIALDRLASLDPTVYPNLSYYASTTTVFKRLTAILLLLQSKEKPVVTIGEKAYFLFSHQHIIRWGKEEIGCGSKEERWQSHKVFLLDLGLLETYCVTGETDHLVLLGIWKKAKAEGKTPETLWTVPLYDDERLANAEYVAGLYRSLGLSVSYLRKNVIIRFRGQARANWLYSNYRKIGEEEQTLLSYCHEAIKSGIEAKGYTTFREVQTRVHAFCSGRPYFQQRMAELLNPEATERQKPYSETLKLILEEKRLLCHEVGCVYRQIRKEDRERLNLPDTLKSWIIVPKD